MIHTQTILVPSLFDASKVLRLNEERIEDLARSAKRRLDDALSKGWRITHFTAFTYERVEYFHYVLERQTEDVTYPKQLLEDIVASNAEDRKQLIAEAADYLRSIQ